MEHRIGRRIALTKQVDLWKGGQHYGCYQLVNIGRGGLFLDCDDQRVAEGKIFTIRFSGPKNSETQSGGLKAMVVHCSNGGAGLMWVGLNESFYADLGSMLSSVA